MWTGGTRDGLPHLELHDRPFLQAVGDAALALDAVRLPVVRAGRVEPELVEVEELRLVLEGAALLLGAADRLVRADHAVGVLLVGLADVDPDLTCTPDAHPERRRLAGRHARVGLGRERGDALLGRCRRRARTGQDQSGGEYTGE